MSFFSKLRDAGNNAVSAISEGKTLSVTADICGYVGGCDGNFRKKGAL